MIETYPSSNVATVAIYLRRLFIVPDVRDSLVYIFGGLKTMLLCIKFSPFHPIIRPSFVSPYVRNLLLGYTLR